MIRCSIGTAKVLGLKEIKTDALPTTAYLMTGERCGNDCSFCPQARNSSGPAGRLSRVTWPEFERSEVISRVAQAFEKQELKRACFQVVNSKDSLRETKELLTELNGKSQVPVCVSSELTNLQGVGELLAGGANRVSIALDAACERIFKEHKGGSWERKRTLLEEAAKAFPGRISTHLIVGLGESEEEMLRTIQEMTDLGITVALFSFTPVKGTKLQKADPPDIGHYRRIQAARFLLVNGFARFEEFSFSQGKLTDFGLNRERLLELLGDGEAFRTSGCPDCNRPYYNEKPGGVIYNYPRPLSAEERDQVLRELNLR